MKVSIGIDGSICGAFLSRRPLTWSTRPGRLFHGQKPARARGFRGPRVRRPHSDAGIRTLCCPSSGQPIPCHWELSRRLAAQSFFGPSYSLPAGKRLSHTEAVTDEFCGQRQSSSPTKTEMLAFVDMTDEDGRVDQHLEFVRDPYLRRYAPADGPNLTVSSREEDDDRPLWQDTPGRPGSELAVVTDLRDAVAARLRNPDGLSPDDIYDIYRQLPEPRMSHLSAKLRHGLLKSFGMIERKNSQSMLRFFALVADVKASGLSLSRGEWNAAISFASRYVGRSTHTETEAALALWREMEQDAGIMGNAVTFNIMFDVASKAGNFALAEMMYKEMERRGFEFNRYHHVSLIHFFGLKMDADGVRAAYKEMVEAGEMIDALTLNCVIASLLRCGEEDAATRTYERMKATHARAPHLPAKTYASQKAVTKVLMMFARLGKRFHDMRAGFQSAASTAPNLATYRILVNHYAVNVGDIATVARYLDEMRFFQVPLHGAIFLALFQAFHVHGGFPGSNWSEQRLKGIWGALLHAIDGNATGLRIDTWLAMAVLQAFDKCSTADAVYMVYDSLSVRWNLAQKDVDFMTAFLHKLRKNRLGGHVDLLQSLGNRSYDFTLK